MSKQPNPKTHHSYEQQVDNLISRGMIIPQRESAIATLQHINYYRLGMYWRIYEENHTTHQFRPGTCLQDVVALYEFDRELRLLVLNALERIEVSIRTQWAYQMSKIYGSHAHMVDKIHDQHWRGNMKTLKREIARSDESFIKRQTEKYSEETPSIWAVSEIMSFGMLSRWYASLRTMSVRKNIARIYDVPHPVLESWIYHFCLMRNACAHHARLWNQHFDRAVPSYPKNNKKLSPAALVDGHPLFNSLLIMLYLLDLICPQHRWRQDFITLTQKYPIAAPAQMGFPDNWPKRWR